jgi:hypothetical protein
MIEDQHDASTVSRMFASRMETLALDLLPNGRRDGSGMPLRSGGRREPSRRSPAGTMRRQRLATKKFE